MYLTSKDTFEAIAANIKGLNTTRHSQLLYGLVRWLQPEVVVEVGPYMGATSVWLARACQENGWGRVYLIEDCSLENRSRDQLMYNLGACQVANACAVRWGPSNREELWPEKVDLAFIDGDHSYAGCRDDVQRAVGKGASCVVVHDIEQWWGPRQWFEEGPMQGFDRIHGNWDSGLAVLMKRQPLGELLYPEAQYPKGRVEFAQTPLASRQDASAEKGAAKDTTASLASPSASGSQGNGVTIPSMAH